MLNLTVFEHLAKNFSSDECECCNKPGEIDGGGQSTRASVDISGDCGLDGRTDGVLAATSSQCTLCQLLARRLARPRCCPSVPHSPLSPLSSTDRRATLLHLGLAPSYFPTAALRRLWARHRRNSDALIGEMTD